MPSTYTAIEAAKILRVKPYTVADWCNRGRFAGATKGDGFLSWVIPHDGLVEFCRDADVLHLVPNIKTESRTA